MAEQVQRLPQHEIDQQFIGSTRVAPGIWLDAHGAVHFSVPELLALINLEDTPGNRSAVIETAKGVARSYEQLLVIRQDSALES